MSTTSLQVYILSSILLSFAADRLDGNGLHQFFQVLPVYFGEIVKNLFIAWSSLEKSVYIFHPVLFEQFHVREKVL